MELNVRISIENGIGAIRLTNDHINLRHPFSEVDALGFLEFAKNGTDRVSTRLGDLTFTVDRNISCGFKDSTLCGWSGVTVTPKDYKTLVSAIAWQIQENVLKFRKEEADVRSTAL